MLRPKILIYILLILSLLPRAKVRCQPESSATATGHIIAEIISAFTASEKSQLNFGRFSPGPEGGEIILSPESAVSVLGSVYRGQGSFNAASFDVTGDVDAAYSITLPSGPVILTHVSDARTMRVENWVSVPAPGAGTGRLQDGLQTVNVGATLIVGTLKDNPVGIYTGTYSITFDFN